MFIKNKHFQIDLFFLLSMHTTNYSIIFSVCLGFLKHDCLEV